VLAEPATQKSRLQGSRRERGRERERERGRGRERERDFLTLPTASAGILGLFYPFLICILMKMHEGRGKAG